MLTEQQKIQTLPQYNKYTLHNNRSSQEELTARCDGYMHGKFFGTGNNIPTTTNRGKEFIKVNGRPLNNISKEVVQEKTSLINKPLLRASKSLYINNKKVNESKKQSFIYHKNENIDFETQNFSLFKNRIESIIPFLSNPVMMNKINNYDVSGSSESIVSNPSITQQSLINNNFLQTNDGSVDNIIYPTIEINNPPPILRCNVPQTNVWNGINIYNQPSTVNNLNSGNIFTNQMDKDCMALQNISNVQSNCRKIPLQNELLKSRYKIVKVLGKGSFGKVFKSFDIIEKQYVALKIIMSNQTASISQSLIEKSILEELNLYDSNKNHIVSLIDDFMWNNHRCLVFELLHMNLYEMLQLTQGKGFDLTTIKTISSKLLRSLSLLYDLDIIHCDLKPENIMISTNYEGLVKLVDFGSSCKVGGQIYSYIQSRFYRAPEVMLELNYSKPIDIWSLGCLLAEISTCEPLFSGRNEVEQMAHIIHYFGFPPINMIINSKKSNKFFCLDITNGSYNFNLDSSINFLGPFSKTLKGYLLKNKSNYEYTNSINGLLFKGVSGIDDSFENFIFSMLNYNPEKRANPYDLMFHPFIFNIICLQLNINNNFMNSLDPNSFQSLIRQHRIKFNNQSNFYNTLPDHNNINNTSNCNDYSNINSLLSISNNINTIPNIWIPNHSDTFNQNYNTSDKSMSIIPQQSIWNIGLENSNMPTFKNDQLVPNNNYLTQNIIPIINNNSLIPFDDRFYPVTTTSGTHDIYNSPSLCLQSIEPHITSNLYDISNTNIHVMNNRIDQQCGGNEQSRKHKNHKGEYYQNKISDSSNTNKYMSSEQRHAIYKLPYIVNNNSNMNLYNHHNFSGVIRK